MSQPLREPLEHLDRELGEANADDHPQLSELRRDTTATLEHSDTHTALAADPSFRTRLEEAVRRYEASHPALTRAAQNVLDVLTANGL
jgi:phosphoenolpyruvate-protein kinase (PTS system EI component)